MIALRLENEGLKGKKSQRDGFMNKLLFAYLCISFHLITQLHNIIQIK